MATLTVSLFKCFSFLFSKNFAGLTPTKKRIKCFSFFCCIAFGSFVSGWHDRHIHTHTHSTSAEILNDKYELWPLDMANNDCFFSSFFFFVVIIRFSLFCDSFRFSLWIAFNSRKSMHRLTHQFHFVVSCLIFFKILRRS